MFNQGELKSALGCCLAPALSEILPLPFHPLSFSSGKEMQTLGIEPRTLGSQARLLTHVAMVGSEDLPLSLWCCYNLPLGICPSPRSICIQGCSFVGILLQFEDLPQFDSQSEVLPFCKWLLPLHRAWGRLLTFRMSSVQSGSWFWVRKWLLVFFAYQCLF